jgi:P-type Cu+ transporter
MKYQIDVKGMHCASCAMTIEKTLKKIDGVTNCNVNFGNEKASLEFDPAKVNISDLSKEIEPYGYSLTMSQVHNTNRMDHSKHLGLSQTKNDKLNELNSLKTEIIIGFIFTAVATLVMTWDITAQLKLVPTMNQAIAEFFHHLLPLFATYSMFVIGKRYIRGVINFLKFGVANMDTLVGIGTLVAFIYSFIITAFEESLKPFINVEHTYYDVVIIVIALISYGKYLESKSKLRTGEAIEKLLNLQAKVALVERNGIIIEIPVDQVIVGDILVVKPGGKIPVDGIIVEGFSSIDESMVTGESIPADKKINDSVIGGTINKQGTFKFKATKVGSETLLAHIVKMVEEVQGSRAPIQKMADKISAVFVPTVLVISAISLIGWIFIGSQFIPINQAFSLGLVSFIGVLVIACPCALGLATPTAIIVGTGKGAENGILIKDAESLEKLSNVNTIVLDKTGTITNGNPMVTDIIPLTNLNEVKILEIIASLEKYSEHPLAEAIIKKANEQNLKLIEVKNFSITEGLGLTGIIDNTVYHAGNIKLLDSLSIKFDKSKVDQLTNQGKTPVILTTDSEALAIIGIADTLKDNAKDTIKELHRLRINVILMSGDNKNTAEYIAKQAGIDDVIAEVLPQDKALKIKDLKHSGKIVAMVGDGVNDATALAESDVGIAMGTGTDVAIESAQITLLKGDISKLLKAIKLSKITMRTIRQNLFWAFIYNLIGIPLAAGVFYPFFGILLNPIFAGFAMAFSSVSVVFNSLRFKFKPL